MIVKCVIFKKMLKYILFFISGVNTKFLNKSGGKTDNPATEYIEYKHSNE